MALDDIDVVAEAANNPPPAVASARTTLEPAADKDGFAGLAALQEKKIADTGRAYDSLTTGLDNDLANLRKRADTVGVEAENIKPWNYEEESAKRRYDPIEAFGSFGSVFGILASAFTRAPMENALNASAAAMGAIKDGKTEDYNRAYKSWQDNTKIALERHKIQNDSYQTAASMLNTNMAAGKAKLEVLAARYGDQKTLFLLQNGMDKEVFDLMASRQKLALELQQAQPKIWLENTKMHDLLGRGYDPNNPTSPQSTQAIQAWQQTWNGRKYDEDADWASKWHTENPEGTSEDFSAAYTAHREKLGTGRSGRVPKPDETEILRRTEEYEAQGMPRAEAYDKAAREVKNASASLNLNRSQTEEIERRARQYEKDEKVPYNQAYDRAAREVREAANPRAGSTRVAKPEEEAVRDIAKTLKAQAEAAGKPITEGEALTQATAQYRRQTTTLSGNRLDDLAGKVDRIGNMETIIGKVEDLLKKHNAITGLGGKITRPLEIIGNVFGSDETDRKQFERYISELQEWGPRALNDSNGRPLAAEVGKINTIIAGLNIGDTAANTERAYRELRELLSKMKGDLEKRRAGPAVGTPSAAPPADTSKKPPSWRSAPVVGPKAELESDEMTA